MVQLSGIHLPPAPEWRTILAGTALFTAGFLSRGFFVNPSRAGIIKSPRSTLLPSLSKEDQSSLPYPPDALPGARDIETPFGTFRAYEWGPEDGRKVLLVHGISTPCLALGGVAHALVEKGCRVMLFDLPGRGYSDTPTDLQHDMRLFTSQILLVLASSPLSWTAATGGFALVGYSLGGGISASFASYFPNMVSSLTLVAPSGLLREHHISRTSRILYSKGIIPEPLLHRIIRKRLQKPSRPRRKEDAPKDATAGVSEAVQAEVDDSDDESPVLSKNHPGVTIEAAVNHQIATHEGFVPAFMSSIRYGPITSEHERWRQISRRLTEKNRNAQKQEKVLMILGKKDQVIVLDEVKEDAEALLGDNIEIKILFAGHEVPITEAEEVARLIWDHWQQFS